MELRLLNENKRCTTTRRNLDSTFSTEFKASNIDPSITNIHISIIALSIITNSNIYIFFSVNQGKEKTSETSRTSHTLLVFILVMPSMGEYNL